MAYRKRAYWPTNCCSPASPSTDTTLSGTLQDTGNAVPAPRLLSSSSMIFPSSTPTTPTLRRYSAFNDSWTPSNRTGQRPSTVVSLPSGISTNAPSHCHVRLRRRNPAPIETPHPKRPQYSPHPHIPITYGTKPQLADELDDSAPLSPDDPIQPSRIIGKLLYYARAVNGTLGVALSALASEQKKPTQRTKRKIIHLLDNCATNPAAKLPLHASPRRLR